jgi:hypothetical protein
MYVILLTDVSLELTRIAAIWTGLPRNLDEKSQKAIRATGKNWKTGDQGASTALAAGFDPALNGESPAVVLQVFALISSKSQIRREFT